MIFIIQLIEFKYLHFISLIIVNHKIIYRNLNRLGLLNCHEVFIQIEKS